MTTWFLLTSCLWGQHLQTTEADLVCGPRCVRQVLQYYGQSVDLVDIIREVQWPDIDDGARLNAIARTLRDHNVECTAFELSPQARIQWSGPVLLHCHTESGADHFLVLMPATARSSATYWDGLNGNTRDIPRGYQLSGIALFTSLEPFGVDEVRKSTRLPPSAFMRRAFVATSLAVAVAIAIWVRITLGARRNRRVVTRD